MMDIFEICGWIGAILVLIAYYLVSTGKAQPHSKSFQVINIGGAIFLVAYTYNCQAYASMIVNVIWIGIGLSSMIKFFNMSNLKVQRKAFMSTRSKFITAVFSLLLLLSSPSILAQESEESNTQMTQTETLDDSPEEIMENDSDESVETDNTPIETESDSE